MASKLEITDYYELLVLQRALWVAKFARDPLAPELPGSPFLADVARRVVETLAQMEIERGYPEKADDWYVTIDPTGEVWQITVEYAARKPDIWRKWSYQEKVEYTKILLSPFTFTDEMVEDFIQQVDELTV